MNTDHLIAKYLDGSITKDEQILLDDAIAKNPDLKTEIDGMKEIDRQLAEPFNLNSQDLKVIDRSFEKVVATYFTGATIGAATTAATSGKLATIASSISSGFVATSLGVVAVASALGYYIYENNNAKPQQDAPKAQIEQVQTPTPVAEPAKVEETPKLQSAAEEVPNTKKPVEAKQIQNLVPKQNTNNVASTPVQTKQAKELDASAKVVSNNDNTDLLTTTKDELNLALSQGNNTKAAYLYKKIALLQKSTSIENASTNLSKSLELARTTSNKELEAECYGELALIDFSRGSNVAKDRARICIDILTTINSNKLNNWKTKLSRIK